MVCWDLQQTDNVMLQRLSNSEAVISDLLENLVFSVLYFYSLIYSTIQYRITFSEGANDIKLNFRQKLNLPNGKIIVICTELTEYLGKTDNCEMENKSCEKVTKFMWKCDCQIGEYNSFVNFLR